MDSVQSLPTDLMSTTQIRFQDCDPFGHLNNARYIDYFMNARSDHLAHFYDFKIMEFGKQPAQSWVVSKSQIAYLSPAMLAEEVVVRTRLINATEHTLQVEAVMLDLQEKRVKSVCWIEFTYVSLATGRPSVHDDALQDFFSTVTFHDEIDFNDFDSRVKHVRNHFRSAYRQG